MALPTLNVLALRNRARRKSGVNASDYSNAVLLEDFNQGYAELVMLLANLGEDYFEEENVKFDLVKNTGLYSLPLDSIAIKQVRLAYSGTPLSPSAYVVATSYDQSEVHDIQADETSASTGNPLVDITNNYVRIMPKPPAAVTNGGRLSYIAMPSALVNTGDTPIIPIAYQEKLAVYGAMQMAFKFEKWNKHARLQKEWEQTMAELQDRLADRDMNRPLRFKLPQEAMLTHSRPRELP
jgi:hypothetical protein